MCRPYDRHPDYCYPGRKATTLCFLVAVFNLPYIFLPGSNGTWLLTRAYFLPGELFILGILLFSYFGTVMHWRKWRGPTLTLALMALTALISGPIISLVGGDKVNTTLIANGIIYGLGAYMTAFCILALLVVRKWASKIDEEEYSNPADFPVTFARKALRMGTLVMMFVWINALLNCPAAMAVLCILLSILNVSLLISALHPHRDNVPDEEAEPERPAAGSVLPPAKAKALADAIRHVVEEEEAFLDSHLTLQEVACRCGTSRTYIANVFRTEFGGFFVYVNTLRLQYADHYAQAHPRAKIGEIIEASGFGSRSSYYAVKAKLRP
jgi:AraC-like DNA-binding protein